MLRDVIIETTQYLDDAYFAVTQTRLTFFLNYAVDEWFVLFLEWQMNVIYWWLSADSVLGIYVTGKAVSEVLHNQSSVDFLQNSMGNLIKSHERSTESPKIMYEKIIITDGIYFAHMGLHRPLLPAEQTEFQITPFGYF